MLFYLQSNTIIYVSLTISGCLLDDTTIGFSVFASVIGLVVLSVYIVYLKRIITSNDLTGLPVDKTKLLALAL